MGPSGDYEGDALINRISDLLETSESSLLPSHNSKRKGGGLGGEAVSDVPLKPHS